MTNRTSDGRQDDVSSEEASKILGIPVSMVRHRMDAGRLPFRQVGSDRRALLSDVLKLKKAEDHRKAVAAELGADTDDLETNYRPRTGNGTDPQIDN